MPILAESTPKRSRRTLGWVWAALPPGFLLAFVVVTAFHPLRIEWGETIVHVGGCGDMLRGSGWHSVDSPAAGAYLFLGQGPSARRYVGAGIAHSRWLQLGERAYVVWWCKI